MTKATTYCDRCGKAMPDKPATAEEKLKAEVTWDEDWRGVPHKWTVEIVMRDEDVPGEPPSRMDVCHDCTQAVVTRALGEKTRRYQ